MTNIILTICIAGLALLLLELLLLFSISNYIENRFGPVMRSGRNPVPPKDLKINPDYKLLKPERK
ncbi:hypothetical protein [Enterococcus sp. BWR-S5]|uniref:hypothetical protein n=1 Tax=Enterococcus sp. BWR-S5 TaxID=2787714 RepID=UPI001924C8D5|nr:hypothetical protein [Enterococcus sp. BWR-S5]MBL1223723.1 hypothetical protein [Enterococcus sp. BWR-S5]